MGFIQAYKMAIRSIASNKVRSFLTMLGVIIGVASVITAVAFAQGSTENITSSIQSLGSNLIQVNIMGRNSNRRVTYNQMKTFADENSDLIDSMSPQVSGSVTVKYGSSNRSTTLLGASSEISDIKNIKVQAGRFLLPIDIDCMQKVAVVGTAVVNDIFEGVNPVGKKMKVNGNAYTVVGVLQETANNQDSSDDDRIIIPFNVAQRLTQASTIKSFSIKAADATKTDAAISSIESFLGGIFSDSNSYTVTSQSQVLSTLSTVTSTLMIILGGFATISLIVGGIGIMNIMLVSVTERTKEIGIRKAIGAKKRNILLQFLIESIIVTGMGGIMGILLGVSIIKFIIGGLNIVPAVYSVTWMIISFSISVVVGVVFGMFPAYKAASLKPIEALRFE